LKFVAELSPEEIEHLNARSREHKIPLAVAESMVRAVLAHEVRDYAKRTMPDLPPEAVAEFDKINEDNVVEILEQMVEGDGSQGVLDDAEVHRWHKRKLAEKTPKPNRKTEDKEIVRTRPCA
jgi:hypothetical protein